MPKILIIFNEFQFFFPCNLFTHNSLFPLLIVARVVEAIDFRVNLNGYHQCGKCHTQL